MFRLFWGMFRTRGRMFQSFSGTFPKTDETFSQSDGTFPKKDGTFPRPLERSPKWVKRPPKATEHSPKKTGHSPKKTKPSPEAWNIPPKRRTVRLFWGAVFRGGRALRPAGWNIRRGRQRPVRADKKPPGMSPFYSNTVHLSERRLFPERPRPRPPGIEIPGYLRSPLPGASKEVPDGTAAGSLGFQPIGLHTSCEAGGAALEGRVLSSLGLKPIRLHTSFLPARRAAGI